jgi:superfamily II DNA or RNA helicase
MSGKDDKVVVKREVIVIDDDDDDDKEDAKKDVKANKVNSKESFWQGYDCLKSLKLRKATNYQQAISYLIANEKDRFIINWEMGLGKTLAAAMVGQCCLAKSFNHKPPIPRKVIIVAMKGSLQSFLRTVKQYPFAHVQSFYSVVTAEAINNNVAKWKELCRNNIVIIDEIHKLKTRIKFSKVKPGQASGSGTSGKDDADANDEEDDEEDDDEDDDQDDSDDSSKKKKKKKQHLLQGRPIQTGKLAASLLDCCVDAWKVVGMTGTLMSNSAEDLVNIAAFTSPLGPLQFLQRVDAIRGIRRMLRDGSCWGSVEYTTLIKRALQCNVSCLDIYDAGVQHLVPTTTEINVLIEMNPTYFMFYKSVEGAKGKDDEDADLANSEYQSILRGEDISEVGAFYSGIRQIANKINGTKEQENEANLLVFISQKLHYMMRIIQKYIQPRKPNSDKSKEKKGSKEKKQTQNARGIITSNWVNRGVDFLFTELKNQNIRAAKIIGTTPKDERTQHVDDFNSGKLDIILLSSAGSTGTDLRGATFHINTENGWHRSGHEQAIRRGVRLGSHEDSAHKHVDIYNLMMAKPGNELEEFAAVMRRSIHEQWAGHPDEVVVIAAEDEKLSREEEKQYMNDLEIDEVVGRPSIDLLMWQMQMNKHRLIFNSMLFVKKVLSIEYNADCKVPAHYPHLKAPSDKDKWQDKIPYLWTVGVHQEQEHLPSASSSSSHASKSNRHLDTDSKRVLLDDEKKEKSSKSSSQARGPANNLKAPVKKVPVKKGTVRGRLQAKLKR